MLVKTDTSGLWTTKENSSGEKEFRVTTLPELAQKERWSNTTTVLLGLHKHTIRATDNSLPLVTVLTVLSGP
jgi:hypothetical protein